MTWLGISYLALSGFAWLVALVYLLQAALIRSDRYVLIVLAAFSAAFGFVDFGASMCVAASGSPMPPPMWSLVMLLAGTATLAFLPPLACWALLDIPLDRWRQGLLALLLALAGARVADVAVWLHANGPAPFEVINGPNATHLSVLDGTLGLVGAVVWYYEGIRALRRGRRYAWLVLGFAIASTLPLALLAIGSVRADGMGAYAGLNAATYLVFLQLLSTQRLLVALRTAHHPSGDFAGYQVIRKLGAGGMGEVFLARRKGPAGFLREVVLKTMQQGGDDPAWNKRFLTEARLAAKLRHPNIVDVYDLGERPDGYFLVMELIDGITLAEAIRGAQASQAPPAAEVVAEVGAQMCRALSFAHAAGVIHRDIKPQNVMVSRDGTVKLIDFGVAQTRRTATPEQHVAADAEASQVSAITQAGGVVGTPGYLSRERLEGKRATVASDLFALGVVLYDALALKPPFPHDSPARLIRAVVEGEFTPLSQARPGLPPPLVQLVEDCLSPSAEKRPASAAAIQVALETFLSGRRVDLAAWVAGLDGAPMVEPTKTLAAAPTARTRDERARKTP